MRPPGGRILNQHFPRFIERIPSFFNVFVEKVAIMDLVIYGGVVDNRNDISDLPVN